MKHILLALILLFFSNNTLYSQNKTIKGRVIAEDFDVLQGVAININDTIEVGKTDIKGFFEIKIPVSENKLTFNFLGLESATIHLTESCDSVDLIMMYDVTYDFIPLKRADKKRKKRYKKLPKIHKQAFKKDIFKTQQPCYDRKFKLLYSEED